MYSCPTSLTDDITMFPVLICGRTEEKSEDTKRVNRNRKSKNKDITVAKRKRTNNDLQNTIHIDQCEPH